MGLNLATVLSILVALYVGHSLYGIWQLFVVPKCTPGATCLDYYLKTGPQLELLIYTSVNGYPRMSDGSVTYVGRVRKFNYTKPLEKSVKIQVPLKTQNNGTLHILVYLVPKGLQETRLAHLHNQFLTGFSYPLTEYLVPSVSAYDLLSGGKKRVHSFSTVTHIKKSLAFKMLVGVDELPAQQLPPELEIEGMVRIIHSKTLLPIMRYNAMNDQLDNLVPLDGRSEVQVDLKYSPASLGKFRFMVMSEVAFRTVKAYGIGDKDMDQLKNLFNNDNKIYLLCVTIVVTSIHILFDVLALKNDVTFWRTRKTLAGLSRKTVMWRAFSQFVIFLFLFEEKSSLLIVVPSFFNVLIEVWKVLKVLRFDIKKMSSDDKKLSRAEETTESIDNEGMRYLLYILFPLCAIGAVYSLLFDHHKSWYSWTINSLVNGVYAFGFLFMLPQLFINYKMKSVAQLPWRAFMYKAFNTFVDDLFAFIIDMPTAHRIACFRDDLVFVIYLYQRWLYPVDKNRIDDTTSIGEALDELAVNKKKN